MKKVLLLLFVYFLGFGMLSAQGMKYFEVEKTTNDNMLRLVPLIFRIGRFIWLLCRKL